MKKFAIAALALAAIAPASVNAEDILFNFEQEGDVYLKSGSYVEYQNSGAAYPNFYVGYANNNVADAATETKLYSTVNIAIECSGPNGYSYSENGNLDCGYNVADSHKYFYQGVIPAGGEYDYTITLTVNYVDETKAPVVKTYKATLDFPTLAPMIELNGDVVDKEGDDARINYNAALKNYSGTQPVSYSIELFEGAYAEGTPVQTLTNAADGFVLTGMKVATDYVYTIKATATSEGLEAPVVATRTFSWTQVAPAATFNIDLAITPGQFTATSATSGTLPFTITATGDTDKVLYYTVKCSRIGDEDMDVHQVTDLTGEFTLTNLPEGATFGVWAKVMATSVDGINTGWVQANPVDCDTRTADALTYTVTAENAVATSSTTGTIDVNIDAQNADKVDYYNVWVVTDGDKEVGRTEVSTMARIYYPYTVTVDLENLNESSVTPPLG